MKLRHGIVSHFQLLGMICGTISALVFRFKVLLAERLDTLSYYEWCKCNFCSLRPRINNLTRGWLPSPLVITLAFLINLLILTIMPTWIFLRVMNEYVSCLICGGLMKMGYDYIDECSYYIDIFTVKHYGGDRDMRALFDIKRLSVFRPTQHHTHGTSAAERTGVSRCLAEAIKNAGHEPYVISMASTDQTHNLSGIRNFYWAKDFKPNYQNDKINKNHAFMMVDVDYYCDMNEYLRRFRPILMYTLSPLTLSYRSSEYAYYIKDNKVHYDVSGGGRYSHEIWDYDHDTLQVRDKYGFNCVFHVTSKTVDNPDLVGSGRRVVSLVPLRKVAPFCYTPPGESLKRKQYTFGKVNLIHNLVSGCISMCENGSYESVMLTSLEYAALRAICSKKTKDLVKGEVQSLLRRRYPDGVSPPYEEFELQTPIIANLASELLDLPVNAISTTGIRVVREASAFTVLGPDTLPVNDFPGQIICSQLVSNSALLPAKNNNNSLASIAGRLTNVRNNVVPPRQYGSYASEFVNMIVPDHMTRKGIPKDFEDIKNLQTRPLQKARIQATEHVQSDNPVNRLVTFIKNEPYATSTDPRNITTMAPEFTLALSRWTYAFKEDCLKTLRAYGPGKTPLETTRILRDVCSNGSILTDYTRFDGTISEWLQKSIVKSAYLRWSSDPATLSQLLDKIFKQTGTTSEGVKYSAYYGTRSGSPTTTDGNTMINMFMVYCALRKLGKGAREAMALLGIYAGDDGVTPLIEGLDSALKLTVQDLGLEVKLQVTKPGEPINYLGRIFPDILKSYSSHQDMCRTLPKLHISTNRQVTKEQAAYNKAAGYYVTDRQTPILGNWARVVMEITNCGQVKNELREEEYRRKNEAWPQAVIDRPLLIQSVARQLNMSTFSVDDLDKSIESVTTLDGFSVLWDNPVEDKRDALIGDSVVIVGTGQSVKASTDLLQTRPKYIADGELPSTSTANVSQSPPKPKQHGNGKRTSASDNTITAGSNGRTDKAKRPNIRSADRPGDPGSSKTRVSKAVLQPSASTNYFRGGFRATQVRLPKQGTSDPRVQSKGHQSAKGTRVCKTQGRSGPPAAIAHSGPSSV